MNDECLKLYKAAEALVAYIDKEDVFDRAAAGGCSGLDFHQSDAFYDLIVIARKIVKEVASGLQADISNSDSAPNFRPKEACSKLIEAVKALSTHIDRERAFDKVSDLGPVGFETHQSEAFSAVVQQAKHAAEQAESGLH